MAGSGGGGGPAPGGSVQQQTQQQQQQQQGSGIGVEVCIYLHNRLAIRVRLHDGLRVTAQELLQFIAEEEETSLPKQALEVFAIWMVSPLLGSSVRLFFFSLSQILSL